MLTDVDVTDEALRQLTICNACRYCEEYCAVFPAIELRRVIQSGDVEYLANLCHDCRDCLDACQYAPPHAFGVNIPLVLARAREASYARATGGGAFGRRLRGPGAWALASGLTAALLIVGLIGATAFLGGALLSRHVGPGAFYRVVPEAVLEIVFLALGAFWLGRWLVAAHSRPAVAKAADAHERPRLSDHLAALRDVAGMTYMGGGGAGCNYPRRRPSQARRWLHQMVAGGFGLDLASTVLAAVYDHVFGVKAPYPVLSPVVILGVLGGVGLIVGGAGLIWQRRRADPAATTAAIAEGGQAFTATLLLVALTGMMVLSLRSTPFMALALVLHLATVATLFLTAPYGRFVHAAMRYGALVRFAAEQRLDRSCPPTIVVGEGDESTTASGQEGGMAR